MAGRMFDTTENYRLATLIFAISFAAAAGRGCNILFIVIGIILAVGMMLIRRIPETLTTDSKAAAAEEI